MAPSTHATLVIVPGSFSFSHFYDPLVNPLRSKGYDIHVLDPPAYPQAELEWQKKYGNEATKPAPPTMYDDAKFTADAIEKLVEEGKDVVVMGHSYGGKFEHYILVVLPFQRRSCHLNNT
jgi:pimeloyl-ACP methyl ester carboxylesterase